MGFLDKLFGKKSKNATPEVVKQEKPVVEEPIVEESVVEEPVVEEPVVEEPVVEEPVVEEPVVEEPVVEEPVVEEPIVEEPVVEEPIVEEPVVEEPIVEEPVVEEPAVEEPAVEEPAVEEPVVEEPAVEEPVVEEPAVEEPAVEEPAVEEPIMTEETRQKEKKSFWGRVKAGLQKTKSALFGQINDLLKNFVKVDEDLLEELEEILICADVGVNAAEEIIDELREEIKEGRLKEKEQVMSTLQGILARMIGEGEPLKLETKPSVILVIGVNGVGKTTSIGKISNQLRKQGKKVVVAAADTFRAAAIDQLAVWCERAKVDLIRQNEGSDPAAVVFDACHAAKNKNADVLIIDTAGRLHNKTNLMNELAKINRVIDRELPDVCRENLLVLDATTGQNAIFQAKEFKNAAQLTGLILNKMDGTAKGGIVISIRQELNIPVKFIGVGEKLDDMQEFDQQEFINALFE